MVSIIMPVYNALPYLEACLESVIDQRLIDWELCAVNDGSTDGSLDVLKAYALGDKRIRVFDNPDKGLINALRLGFRRSYGEFITRMDADDLMMPSKLESLLRHCVLHDHIVAVGKVEYFADEGVKEGYTRYADWLNGLIDERNHWSEVYKECVIPSPCWMMRREDFVSIGAFDADRYPEDYDLAFRMYASGIEVIGDTDVLHLWRDHPRRSSRTDEHYSDNRFLDIKLHYFLQLEAKRHDTLVLWGAGSKGKHIAKRLLEGEVDFSWATDNPAKVGVDIYGKVLLAGSSAETWADDTRYIMAVATPADQVDLKQRLQGKSRVHWFC